MRCAGRQWLQRSLACWNGSLVAEPAAADPGGRLFLALWPGAALRAAIAQASRAALLAAGGRPVPPVDYHLTLAFLGSASPGQREQLTSLTVGLRAPHCRLELDRFGYFRSAGVFWLGPRLVPPLLSGFVAGLWRELAVLGFVPDGRPFRPHVTLARKACQPPALAPPERAPGWPVRDLVLADSAPGAGQPGRYRIIARSAG